MAIAARPATTAESIPPLRPTTIPREPAAATRSFSHSAMSCARVCMTLFVRRRSGFAPLDHAQETVDETGIELASALAVDLADRVIDRPGVLVRPLLGERIEHVRHGNDPPGQWNRIP